MTFWGHCLFIFRTSRMSGPDETNQITMNKTPENQPSEQPQVPPGRGSLDPSVRRFRDLPLGTRFRYKNGDAVWVVLERHGCGLIAKWGGIDGPTWGQSICSLTETETQCETLEVEVIDFANDKLTNPRP